MENFLTAFENYFIEILFELARKDTLTLHSALLTLHLKRTIHNVTKNCKTSIYKNPNTYDTPIDLACDEAD